MTATMVAVLGRGSTSASACRASTPAILLYYTMYYIAYYTMIYYNILYYTTIDYTVIGYEREQGRPDPVCLSFTHDRDYGVFKPYTEPKGGASAVAQTSLNLENEALLLLRGSWGGRLFVICRLLNERFWRVPRKSCDDSLAQGAERRAP